VSPSLGVRFARNIPKNPKRDKAIEKLKAEYQIKLDKLGNEFERKLKELQDD
jgi:hypothetical protein